MNDILKLEKLNVYVWDIYYEWGYVFILHKDIVYTDNGQPIYKDIEGNLYMMKKYTEENLELGYFRIIDRDLNGYLLPKYKNKIYPKIIMASSENRADEGGLIIWDIYGHSHLSNVIDNDRLYRPLIKFSNDEKIEIYVYNELKRHHTLIKSENIIKLENNNEFDRDIKYYKDDKDNIFRYFDDKLKIIKINIYID